MAITDGLVSFYKLDGDATDVLGTNNGTATNVSWVAGKINNGGSFNGSSSKIIGGLTNIPLSGDISVSCWIYQNSHTGYQDIVAARTGTTLRWILYKHSTDGAISFHGANQNKTTLIPTLNQWVHVTATVASGTLKIYIDGVLSYTLGGYTYHGGTAPTTLSIGCTGGASPTEYFNGLIDEVGIRNRALTQDEITQLYNNGSGIAYPLYNYGIANEPTRTRYRNELGQIDAVGQYVSSLPIPALTSNSQNGYIVTASNDLAGQQSGRQAFDGATNYDWHSASIGSGGIAYIQIQLPAIATATQLYFKARAGDPNNIQPATTITLQGSNNGSTWTQLFTQSGLSWTLGQERTFTITSPGSYLYYKINMTASSTGYVATNQIGLL